MSIGQNWLALHYTGEFYQDPYMAYEIIPRLTGLVFHSHTAFVKTRGPWSQWCTEDPCSVDSTQNAQGLHELCLSSHALLKLLGQPWRSLGN